MATSSTSMTTPLMTTIERGAVVARLESKANGAQCVDVVECRLDAASRWQLCVDKHTQMTTTDPWLANAALRELDMHFTLRQQQRHQQQHNYAQRSHVTQLLGFHLDGERLHLFHEFCARGDLLSIVRHDLRMESAGLPVAVNELSTRSIEGVKRIFAQTLAGVAELHRAGIAHLDLSLENVFLNADGHVCVGDLGLAERFERNGVGHVERQCPQSVAKVAYAAPEMHAAFAAGIPIDVSKADAWALGVLLWHLVFKQPLFETAMRDDPLFYCMERSGSTAAFATRTAFAAAPVALRDLLTRLLCVDPHARLSVSDAQRHPWLQTTSTLSHAAPIVALVPAVAITTVTAKPVATSRVLTSRATITNASTTKPKRAKMRSGSCGGEIALEKTRVSIRRSIPAARSSMSSAPTAC